MASDEENIHIRYASMSSFGFGCTKLGLRRFQFAIPYVLLLIAFIFLLLMLCGCQKKAAAPIPLPTATPEKPPEEPPPPAITPPVKVDPEPVPSQPASDPTTVPKPSSLDLGEVNFRAGNYPEAIQIFQAYIKENPKSQGCDRAMFHLALSHALSGGSDRNLRRAESALKRLISEFPYSQYRRQAEFILKLWDQIDKLKLDIEEREKRIEQLSEELQKLKEIDIQRRPSSP